VSINLLLVNSAVRAGTYTVGVIGVAWAKAQTATDSPSSYFPDPRGTANRYIRVDWDATPSADDVTTAGNIIAALDVRKRRPRAATALYTDIRALSNGDQLKAFAVVLAVSLRNNPDLLDKVNHVISTPLVMDEIDPDG
jgi:hypothetical protein